MGECALCKVVMLSWTEVMPRGHRRALCQPQQGDASPGRHSVGACGFLLCTWEGKMNKLLFGWVFCTSLSVFLFLFVFLKDRVRTGFLLPGMSHCVRRLLKGRP